MIQGAEGPSEIGSTNKEVVSQVIQSEHQRLLEMLVERTGQPREKVDIWISGLYKVIAGSKTVYEVSGKMKDYISKQTSDAKPYLIRFGRSLVRAYERERDRRLFLMGMMPSPGSPINDTPNSSPTADQGRAHPTKKRARGISIRKSRSRASRFHNPWASDQVLRTQAIFISSYPIKSKIS